MRGKTSEVETSEDQYGFRSLDRDVSKKRLDLNDLLLRAKTERKIDKKNNLIIISGAASAILLLLIVISVY